MCSDKPAEHDKQGAGHTGPKRLSDTGLKAMQVRGRMQEGMVADIVIFDPKTVTDNSTYEKGAVPSSGIPHAIVNGIIVMKDSEPLPRFEAGQPIRFEVQEKGRFTPLSQESWQEKYYVLPEGEDINDYGTDGLGKR
jgi:hypothetical protein